MLNIKIDEFEIFALEKRLMYAHKTGVAKKKKINLAQIYLQCLIRGYQ
jgi:hypothetical protein